MDTVACGTIVMGCEVLKKDMAIGVPALLVLVDVGDEATEMPIVELGLCSPRAASRCFSQVELTIILAQPQARTVCAHGWVPCLFTDKVAG